MAGTSRSVASDLLPHLRRARDHIDRHYQAQLDLDRLSAVAGVSKFHFARGFAATYGETPIRYLTRRRIERAQDLLRHANLNRHGGVRDGGFLEPRIVLLAVRSARG